MRAEDRGILRQGRVFTPGGGEGIGGEGCCHSVHPVNPFGVAIWRGMGQAIGVAEYDKRHRVPLCFGRIVEDMTPGSTAISPSLAQRLAI